VPSKFYSRSSSFVTYLSHSILLVTESAFCDIILTNCSQSFVKYAMHIFVYPSGIIHNKHLSGFIN